MSSSEQTATSAPARARAARRQPTAKADTYSLNRVRCRRGRVLFRERAAEIWRVGPDAYRVPSQADGGIYRISLKPGDLYCKHLYAALVWQVKSAAALAESAAA